MTEPVLLVQELTTGYAGGAVLRDISLSVAAGEVLAVLGANGAGKSTLLKSISGLLSPMNGSVTVLGQRADTRRPHRVARRGVAHVSEGRSVFFGLTVAEHLRLKPRGGKVDTDLAYEYFPRLRELAGRRAGLLSGGEQQMLALGRALAGSPRLLLIDELSLGLAPVIVERMLPVVRSFARDTGAGVVLVEQHVELALEVADRACVLSHGNLVVDRPAVELRDDDELLRASYLGEVGAA
jgi:branched-chain amino acid transport system ATP-binding protein